MIKYLKRGKDSAAISAADAKFGKPLKPFLPTLAHVAMKQSKNIQENLTIGIQMNLPCRKTR